MMNENERPKFIFSALDSSQINVFEQWSDQDFWDYAKAQANPIRPVVPKEDYLECLSGRENFLISLKSLNEVVMPPFALAYLPASPDWLAGIMAWHSEIIPVVDLGRYLFGNEISRADYSADGVILVTGHKDHLVGLWVNKMGQTMALLADELSLPDELFDTQLTLIDVIDGVYGKALVLNIGVLLTEVVRHIEIAAPNG